MTLSYRGIPYDKPSLALDINCGEVKGKYRGQDWQQHYPRPLPQLRTKPAMIYRGVSVSEQSASPVSVAQVCPVPVQHVRKVVTDDLNRIHFDNIRKSLEKRLAIAQAKGDRPLIQQLEREYEQLTAI